MTSFASFKAAALRAYLGHLGFLPPNILQTWMDGEYPAAEKPDRNLPDRIMGRFCDDAIKIQPIKSGTAMARIVFRRPNREPRKALPKPPKMAPRPKIEARTEVCLVR